jgi:uncharacterized protein DUF4236
MGFRFRKSVSILPGVRLNFGKQGFSSVSVGRKGFTMSAGRRGTRTTVGLPGTGLSYSWTHRSRLRRDRPGAGDGTPPSSHTRTWVGSVVLVGLLLVGYVLTWLVS